MDVKTWSRGDQVFLEGALWAFPAVGLLAVVVRAVDAVRGAPLEVTGSLPEALVRPVAQVSGPYSGTLVLPGATTGDHLLALVPGLLVVALVAAGAGLLLAVVRSLRAGDPFTPRNARRLTRLAVLVLVGGLGVQVVGDLVHTQLLAAALPAGQDRPLALDLALWPAPVATALFFIAEVFARGARLREDVEGLV